LLDVIVTSLCKYLAGCSFLST